MSQNTTAMQRGAGGETTGATDMTTQQSYALYLADELELGTFVPNVLQNEAALRQRTAAELRRQHAHITELESQLAQRFDAADMATAAAQGFRDGVASVSAGSEPVASYAIRLLVAAALITQAKADEALRLAAEITAAPGPADGESNV